MSDKIRIDASVATECLLRTSLELKIADLIEGALLITLDTESLISFLMSTNKTIPNHYSSLQSVSALTLFS